VSQKRRLLGMMLSYFNRARMRGAKAFAVQYLIDVLVDPQTLLRAICIPPAGRLHAASHFSIVG